MAQLLTPRQLLAAASQVLTDNEYVEVRTSPDSLSSGRVFEDAYGIVALHAYESWADLKEQWHLAQGSLVDLISEHLRRAEPKAWEGYLVLLTPGVLSAKERAALTELRNDTNRVRKLVSIGGDLATLDDVRTALLPLLPLRVGESVSPREPMLLGLMPEILARRGISLSVTAAVIEAFTTNQSILERLHALESLS